MPVMLVLSVFMATLALAVAVFSLLVNRVPGAHPITLSPRLLVAASVYALADGLGYVPAIPPMARASVAGAAMAVSGLFLLIAARHVARVGGHLRETSFRVMQGALVAAMLACMVPGAVYSTTVVAREFALVNSTYYETQPTLLGYVVFGTYAGVLVAVFRRMLGDVRRGVPQAGYYAAAFGVLVAATVSDLLSALGVSQLPYVLSEGTFLAALTFGAALVRQILDDRAALEQLRVELEAKVEHRTRDLRERTVELARSERHAVVGRLAAGIAHELNNPVAAIKASLDDARGELSRGIRDAELMACIDISLAGVERVTRIVRQLGAMAGGAEATGQLLATTRLESAVRAAVAAARDQQRAEVELSVNVESGLWVHGLATAVEEAVTAIVLNAVQAVPDHRPGLVSISARPVDNEVVLVVRDNGVGMREEVVARAFEPFFTTKELGRSSGLGLPVAKGLVETMGGTLGLRSIVGVGTEATIRLRLGPAAEISGPKARPLDAASRGVHPPGPPRRPRILLVDDDELVRLAMRRYLAKSFEVDTASSVAEGLARVSRAYDAILSDVVMPDGGGQRFFLDLMARDPELASRVIFVTGGAFRGDLQEFLQTQTQPVLNKPVRLSELKTVIARLVAAAAPTNGQR